MPGALTPGKTVAHTVSRFLKLLATVADTSSLGEVFFMGEVFLQNRIEQHVY